MQQKNMTQETAADISRINWNPALKTDRGTQEETNAWTII
jgi:hypothetical protein